MFILALERRLPRFAQFRPKNDLCFGHAIARAGRFPRLALTRFAGHRRRTAKALGISVRTLQNKIKRWLLE